MKRASPLSLNDTFERPERASANQREKNHEPPSLKKRQQSHWHRHLLRTTETNSKAKKKNSCRLCTTWNITTDTCVGGGKSRTKWQTADLLMVNRPNEEPFQNKLFSPTHHVHLFRLHISGERNLSYPDAWSSLSDAENKICGLLCIHRVLKSQVGQRKVLLFHSLKKIKNKMK